MSMLLGRTCFPDILPDIVKPYIASCPQLCVKALQHIGPYPNSLCDQSGLKIKCWCALVFCEIVHVMSQDYVRLRPLHQRLDDLVAPYPALEVPHQPSLRNRTLIVLLDVIHVGREDPCPTVPQVDLQDAEPWGVARSMSDIQAWRELNEVAHHRLPVHVEAEIVRKVDSWVKRSVSLRSEFVTDR